MSPSSLFQFLLICDFLSLLILFSLITFSLLSNLFLSPSVLLVFYRINYGYAILMEDIGGTALTNLYNHTKQGLPLDVFLEIACKIST